jgi:hypothetical protein
MSATRSVKVGLTAEQRQRFDEQGLVKLCGFIPREAAEAMADRLWRELARKHGVRRDQPQSWRAERPAQLGAFQKTGAFNGMATPELRAVLDELIGRDRWAEPSSWGLPLVCFPQGAQTWELPHQVWHFDLTPDPRLRGAMVGRIFVLLAPLAPRGGGTLVATGSHLVAEAIFQQRGAHRSSQEMRKQLLAASPWFRDLMSPARGEDRIARFMGSTTVVDGIPLRVEEITGEPGDVFLMHPHALHGLSSNVRDHPRLALSQTVYPKSWYGG